MARDLRGEDQLPPISKRIPGALQWTKSSVGATFVERRKNLLRRAHIQQ